MVGLFRRLWRCLRPVPTVAIKGIRTYRISICEATGDAPEVRTELDSHADTCVLGRNALITHDYERPVHVTGYDKADGTKKYRTVSGVIGYQDPKTGRNHYLHVHQGIHMPQLTHNLLCPMQLRLNDILVDKEPKFLADGPTEKTHAIEIPIDEDDSLVISLSLDGSRAIFQRLSLPLRSLKLQRKVKTYTRLPMPRLSGTRTTRILLKEKNPCWMHPDKCTTGGCDDRTGSALFLLHMRNNPTTTLRMRCITIGGFWQFNQDLDLRQQTGDERTAMGVAFSARSVRCLLPQPRSLIRKLWPDDGALASRPL